VVPDRSGKKPAVGKDLQNIAAEQKIVPLNLMLREAREPRNDDVTLVFIQLQNS
jgi:hypothetical protein